MKSILVVCEGNICRSPMAEGMLAAALPRCRVASAGLGALVGAPADPTAVRLMREIGIDISKHRSTQISASMCLQSELILVMESDQRDRIQLMFPEVRGRVFRVREQAQMDVVDPYRQPEDAFQQVLRHIHEGVEAWLRRIKRIQEFQS